MNVKHAYQLGWVVGMQKRSSLASLLTGGGLGALAGGGLGALAGGDEEDEEKAKKNKLRNILLGILGGGALGTGAGALLGGRGAAGGEEEGGGSIFGDILPAPGKIKEDVGGVLDAFLGPFRGN